MAGKAAGAFTSINKSKEGASFESVNSGFAMQQCRLCNAAKSYLHHSKSVFAIEHCSLQRGVEEWMPDSDRYKIPPHNLSGAVTNGFR